MTRDYVRMKTVEAKEITWKFYLYIIGASLINKCLNPMIQHLNERGIFTNYWVINDDDEVLRVLRETKVQGIMTDRPSRVRQLVDFHHHQKLQMLKSQN